MSQASPVLHMLCGKVASGKSTVCAELARELSTIVVARDHRTAADAFKKSQSRVGLAKLHSSLEYGPDIHESMDHIATSWNRWIRDQGSRGTSSRLDPTA
jgi:cytidylate kinase